MGPWLDLQRGLAKENEVVTSQSLCLSDFISYRVKYERKSWCHLLCYDSRRFASPEATEKELLNPDFRPSKLSKANLFYLQRSQP